MGSGISGLYSGTYGSRVHLVAGDISFMDPKDRFIKNIVKRKDIDPNGYFDIIAHGSYKSVQIFSIGQKIELKVNQFIKYLKSVKEYKGGNIRLLSCNIGAIDTGFAQNLANKLNVTVYAPTKILWSWPSGEYIVVGKINSDTPNLNDKGIFKIFKPKRRKQKCLKN